MNHLLGNLEDENLKIKIHKVVTKVTNDEQLLITHRTILYQLYH